MCLLTDRREDLQLRLELWGPKCLLTSNSFISLHFCLLPLAWSHYWGGGDHSDETVGSKKLANSWEGCGNQPRVEDRERCQPASLLDQVMANADLPA